MADIIDIANERADEILEEQIAKRKPTGPKPSGKCHNCDEPVTGFKRWCDKDCRDDWEKRQQIRYKIFADGVEKDVDDFDE